MPKTLVHVHRNLSVTISARLLVDSGSWMFVPHIEAQESEDICASSSGDGVHNFVTRSILKQLVLIQFDDDGLETLWGQHGNRQIA